MHCQKYILEVNSHFPLRCFNILSLQKTAKLQLFKRAKVSCPAKLWTLEQNSKSQNTTWHFYCVIHGAVCLLLFRSIVVQVVYKQHLQIQKALRIFRMNAYSLSFVGQCSIPLFCERQNNNITTKIAERIRKNHH